jgi:hypothetical protein
MSIYKDVTVSKKPSEEAVFNGWYEAITSGRLRHKEYHPDMLRRIYTDLTKKQQKQYQRKYALMCYLCKNSEYSNARTGRRTHQGGRV